MLSLTIKKRYPIHFFKLQHLRRCNLAYEHVLHVGNYKRFGITISEGFVSRMHCHFTLPFKFCLIYSRWCSRRNSFMFTKIYLKLISDTVILICMSFLYMGIFSKQYNYAFGGYLFTFTKKIVLIWNMI